jgi:lysophospholipase L1-like esterase
MKNLNEKKLKLILIASVCVNFLYLGTVVKRMFDKNNQDKARAGLVVTTQPVKVSYYLGRNEVFEKLPNTESEIVMVGNSLTHNFEWHEMFRDVNIINRGIGSDITKGVLQRLNEIIESKPLKIFLMIGINDIGRGYPMDSIYSNYVKIIQSIKLLSPETRIYVQSVLPCRQLLNNNIIELNKRLNNYCLNTGLTYIDLYSKFVSEQKLNPKYDSGDNVHLNGDGYLLWCTLIREYVNE